MSSTRQLTLLSPDGSLLQDHVLGMGRTGVVVQRNGTALKLPLKYSTAGPNDAPIEDFKASADISYESLRREKYVYERLGQYYGIVPCLDLSGDGIQMEFMANGDLLHYLTQHRPSQDTQRTWFQEMARTLIHTHDRRVIVADIATRNFLLDSGLSVKFSDFAESTILPLNTNMQTADDGGFSIYTDIGQFGAVLYEIVTGQSCEFDLFKHVPPGPATAVWPRRQDLPSTENVWLSSIIEKCWTKGAYQNARELLTALETACDVHDHSQGQLKLPQPGLRRFFEPKYQKVVKILKVSSILSDYNPSSLTVS